MNLYDLIIIDPHTRLPSESMGHLISMNVAESMASKGIKIAIVTSSFSHSLKSQRTSLWFDSYSYRGCDYYLIKATGYKNHIGLARIFWHISFTFFFMIYWKRIGFAKLISVSTPLPFFDYLIPILRGKMCNKIVVQVRDLWPEHFTTAIPKHSILPIKIIYNFFKWMRSRALKNADYVIAASKRILDTVSHDLEIKNGLIIYNSTKIPSSINNSILRVFRQDPNEILFNYSGTLGETYDLELLIEATRYLAKNNNSIKFRLIVSGIGPKAKLFHGLSEDIPVTYVGLLSDLDLVSLYDQLDFTILPYKIGSTVDVPAKVFDYLQRCIPLVYSLSGELDEILHDAQGAGKFEAGNIKSLVHQLRLFMIEEVRYKARCGLRVISKNYSWDHAVEEFSRAYNILLES